MRKTTILAAGVLSLALAGVVSTASAQAPAPTDQAAPAPDATPAPDAEKPAAMPMKHHHKKMMMKGDKMKKGEKSGDAAVEDLNAKSLEAAKSNQAFTPPK